MSTLKVDSIQPNVQSQVTIDSNVVVTGASTLQGNATAQGNLDVSGALDVSGSLDASQIAMNGASPGGAGAITGASTIGCSDVVATGAISSASLSVSGGAAVGSLSIGGDAYDQRVPVHCTLELASAISGTGFSGDPANGPAITLLNNRGVSSAEWIAGPGAGQRQIRVVLENSLTRPRFPVLIQLVGSAFAVGPNSTPGFVIDSNTRLLIQSASVTFKYIQIAMFG